MILYLPEIYEDETIYSFLSRAYEKGGYVSQVQAMEEFLINPKERLDFMFCNALDDEIISYVTQNCKWDEFLSKHTLCNYYGRYLKKDRRVQAMRALTESKGNYNNLFSITPNRKGAEYLKYCPICVKENRDKYGETYWNRLHQVPELKVCPKHKCKLLDSMIESNRHKIRTFNTAENNIINLDSEQGTGLEIKLAEYIDEMVHTPIMLYNDIQVGEFLVSQMRNTKYLSNRGQIINISLIYKDMMEVYKNLENSISMSWQISKILHGERINPYEISQIGMFLKISPKELIECKLPSKKPEEDFDDKVIELLCDGKSAYQVSRELGVSNTLINLIRSKQGISNYKSYKYVTNKHNDKNQKIADLRKIWSKTMTEYPGYSFSQICEISEYKLQLRWLRRNDFEWTEMHFPKKTKSMAKVNRLSKLDDEYFFKIEDIIKEYKGEGEKKPERVTINAISKVIGIKNRDLYNMRKCREIIKKYEESQEEFWLRKIIWALSVVEKKDLKLSWNTVRNLIHMSRNNFYKHKDYFSSRIGAEVIDIISPK